MSTKKWCIFIIALSVLMLICAILNVFAAGAFFLIVLLFEASEAAIVYKWVYAILMIIEFGISAPYTYSYVKNERNER